jgi:hypothetical protein
MVSHCCIKEPEVRGSSNRKCDSTVASWYGVGNLTSDLVEGYIIDTELPNKITNVRDMFLMWFGRKKGFK